MIATKKGLLDYVQENLLIGDGAMGTLLYRYGIPIESCLELLNVTHPAIVRDIHSSYRRAGANLIETNTFGANAEKLAKFGLEEEVDRINRAAVSIAREAAGHDAYVVGAVGGIRGSGKKIVPRPVLESAYAEQIDSLAAAGVDGIMLESFYDVDEALLALSLVRKHGSVPAICQLTIRDTDRTQDGYSLKDAFGLLRNAGAPIVGLNCGNGPAPMIRSLETIPAVNGIIVSAYPNAGFPDDADGHMRSSSPDEFGRMANTLHELGVRIIGGCCGTTPEHIAAVSSMLQGKFPIVRHSVVSVQPRQNTLAETVQEQTAVIVELDPPRDLEYSPYLEGAAALKEAGADAITLADNSLAITRMSNMALGTLVRERVGIRPLLHVSCRDRNLIAQQSHMMGLHALGIDHVLAVTGDHPHFGDFPRAAPVYDTTSLEMIRLIKKLNEGISFSGRPLKARAAFTVGAAFNPNTRHLNKAVERLEKKIAAGADYAMSQPLFCHQQIEQVAQAAQRLAIPIFIGIMPLTSYRNAEFLHNNVPGIRISDDVLDKMARYQGEDARKQGLEIAMELLDTVCRHFKGIYLITPFMRYEMTAQLARYVKHKK